MELRPDVSITPRPGDFRSRVDDGALVVPAQLAHFAQTYRLRTAEALAGYAGTYPGALAVTLGWGEPQVKLALQRLNDQIVGQGVLRRCELNPPLPSTLFGFGGRID